MYYGPAEAENAKRDIFCGAASKMIPTEPQLPLVDHMGELNWEISILVAWITKILNFLKFQNL